MKFRIDDFSEAFQRQIRAKLGNETVTKTIPEMQGQGGAVEETKRKKPHEPNKTELCYKQEVLDRVPGVSGITYEPLTFKLGNGHRYSPDWIYQKDGKLHCVEVKGSYKLGSYQRARLAFDQARVEFPWAVWIWAERFEREWKIKS